MPFRALSDLLGWRVSQRMIDVCQLAAYLFLVAIVAVGFWRLQTVATRNHTALSALCSFRADLADRTDQTAAYIADIRDGRRPPIPGISINDLRRSLYAQQRTLMSMKSLSCRG